MKSPTKLRELILEKLDMGKVLLDYHVKFVYSPNFTDETQLRCPFHGKDNKPSARYYKTTQSMYCWVCLKSWDVIQFIMEKEQIYYIRALSFLIDKYKIDISSISDEPDFKPLKMKEKISVSKNTVKMTLLKRKIQGFRGKISFEKYRALCSVYYMIMYELSQEKDVLDSTKKLEAKLNTIS